MPVDLFDRADGALGANWTELTAINNSTPAIASGAVVGAGGDAGAVWTADEFPADQDSRLTIGAPPSSNETLLALVRVSNLASPAMYYAWLNANQTPFVLTFGYYQAGSWHDIASRPLLANPTASFGIRATGANPVILTAYVDDIPLLAFYDHTVLLTDGRPGFMIYGTAPSVDAWQSTIPDPTTPITVPLLDYTTGRNPATGLSPSAYIAIDDGAETLLAADLPEIDTGVYALELPQFNPTWKSARIRISADGARTQHLTILGNNL